MKNKLYQIKTLIKVLKNKKLKFQKIVYCHGVFDLLHIGHIKHLKKAKDLGDILVVSLTADKFVNKGPGKPVFNQSLRSEALAALDCVDYVLINEAPTAVNMIKLLKPDIYCKGKDYKNFKDDITGEIRNEVKSLKRFGGKIVFTEEITFSSSRLINRTTDFYSDNKKKF